MLTLSIGESRPHKWKLFAWLIELVEKTDHTHSFASWKDPEEILRLATIVVFPRDGAPSNLEVEGEASLIVFEEPVLDVSSNDIRKKYRTGEPVGSLVPETVHNYILDSSLYCR